MKNFGEELAYWYFRLNGFFLIDNFVLHRADLEGACDADSDLIGIRNPETVERVGLADSEDICERLSEIIDTICAKPAAIICEVKAGQHEGNLRLGDHDRLNYAIKRLGVFSSEEIEGVQNHLLNHSRFDNDKISIHKIVVSQFYYQDEKFVFLSLDNVEQHIVGKFAKYREEKNAAWVYFPSSLMQYLIWKGNRSLD